MKLTFLHILFSAALVCLSDARMESRLKAHGNMIKRADPSKQASKCDGPTKRTASDKGSSSSSMYGGGHHASHGTTTPSSSPRGIRPGSPPSGSKGLLSANTLHPDFILGVAIHADYLKNAVLSQCILENFNLLVPEYEAKSAAIHQYEESWQFEATDSILAFTKKNNMNFKIHTLFFDQTMAPYFEQYRHNADGLKKAMTNHTTGMLQRYGNEALVIDVVNEIMAYAGDGQMKSDIFEQTLSNEYLPFVFNTAHQLNAHPILSLNENDVEGESVKGLPHKYSGFISVLQEQRKLRTPIHAVGLECHFELGKVPQDLEKVIGTIVDMGFEVMITELDIKNPQNDVQQQSKDFAQVVAACMAHFPKCKGVIFWGLTDDLDWLGEGDHSTLYASGCKDKGVTDGVKKVSQSGRL